MTKTKSARINIVQAVSRRTFHNAVIATYTFDARFFEDYCLKKFPSLMSNGNISVLLDLSTYRGIVEAGESERPHYANLRYLLHPISVPGRFHSKIVLLTSTHAGRLLLGSANFTRPGITTNAEVVQCFEFEEGSDEQYLSLFREVWSFICKAAERWPGDALNSNINEMQLTTPWLVKTGTGSGIAFLHNLNVPLIEQLTAAVPPNVRRIFVVSRFFDGKPSLIDILQSRWKAAEINIFTQNGRTTLTPDWLLHPRFRENSLRIFLGSYEDEGHIQPLHAKLFIFETSDRYYIAYGSANFTSAALICTASTRNVENLVLYLPISKRALDIRPLYDPALSAIRLKRKEDLQTSNEDKSLPPAEKFPIEIKEASLNDKCINIRAVIPSGYDLASLFVGLELSSGQNLKLPLTSYGELVIVDVPDQLLQMLNSKTSILFFQKQSRRDLVSNKVLLINILDIETNTSIRRERQIREAKQSPQQFFAVLNDLIRSNDEAALLAFLNFCDIPLINAPRPPILRGRPVWEGRDGMRLLGIRNLQICKTLHEAALSFFERHMRKLKRHSESLFLEGAANFLHIFLSMGGLLRAQIERTVVALEEMPGVMTADQWLECRTFWDIYFRKFEELMTSFWDEYLEPISHEYARDDLKGAFSPDLDAVHELVDEMMRYRSRIEQVRKTKCITTDYYGTRVELQYFYCILGNEPWARLSRELISKKQSVDIAILGRMQQPSAAQQSSH